MKRILIDARMVKAEGHGIGNYVCQMAEGLARIRKPYELIYLVSKSLPASHPLRREKHHDSAVRFLHPLEPFLLRNEVDRLRPDLFHSPSFVSLWSYSVAHIQTVHDLNHIHFGSLLQRLYYAWLLMPSLRKAKAVLTVSESAKSEITAWLRSQGIEIEIQLAENAILEPGQETDSAPLSKWKLSPRNFFLALANSKPFKNLAFLESAYRSANTTGDLPPLVINTPGSSGGGVIHTGQLSEAELRALLANARAFFFPSLYEGFGRTPLEAAVAGTIPVVSDIPPHREGLAAVSEAVFLSPQDEAAWSAVFVSPPEGRVSDHSKKQILERYSQAKLAQRMHEIYLAALGVKG